MPNYTNYLNLKQPGGDEDALIQDINDNMTKIDQFAGTIGGYTIMPSGTDFNTLKTRKNYLVGNITQMSHYPTNVGSSGYLYVDNYSTYILQRFYGNLGIAHRFSYDSGSTWVTWVNPNPKKGPAITTVSSDTEILALDNGVYQVNLSATSPYIPERWGTLIIDHTGTTYGAAIYISTNGIIYTRHMNGSSAWHGAWKSPSFYSYTTGNTLANIQNSLVTLGETMLNGEIRPVGFSITEATSVFRITTYIGQIMRLSSSRLMVNLRQSMDACVAIVGNYKDGTWYWSELQTKINVLDFNNTSTGNYQTNIPKGNVIACHVMNWSTDVAAVILNGTGDKALVHVYSVSTGNTVTNTSVALRLYYI